MIKLFIITLSTCLLLFIFACAPEVVKHPSGFLSISEADNQRPIYLTKDVIIDLPTGYQRTLKRESRWDFCGKIAEGNVYKPHDQVFTVEGAHVHEAYLVISNGQLVGFYLPVEKARHPRC